MTHKPLSRLMFLVNISSRMLGHYLNLTWPNISQLLYIPGHTSPCQDLITLLSRGNCMITPSDHGQNLGVAPQPHSCLSRLAYCNLRPAGLPMSNNITKQLTQNAASLVREHEDIENIMSLLCYIYWLPVAAHVRIKTPMLACKVKNHHLPEDTD